MVLLELIGVALAIYFFYHRDYFAKVYRIPSPIYVPLLGEFLLLLRHKLNIIQALSLTTNRNGDIFRLWARTLIVVVTSPEHMETACTNPYVQERGIFGEGVAELLGQDGLLTANWDASISVKKSFHKTFTASSQEIVFENFRKANQTLLEALKDHEGQWIESLDFLRDANLVSILGTTCSIDSTVQHLDLKHRFLPHLDNLIFLMVCRGLSILHRNNFLYYKFFGGNEAFENMHIFDVLGQMRIDEKRTELSSLTAEGKEVPNQYVYNVLREKPCKSDQDILTDFKTLIITALDTSALTAGFTLMMLAIHPDIQQLVYEEDQRIQNELQGQNLNGKTIAKYEYLSLVIKEVLRMYPAVPALPRSVTQETKFGKYIVPKGSIVVASTLTLHRDPTIYDRPSVFDPKRFLPENAVKRPKYSYLPFGAGPRSCPGFRYGTQSTICLVSTVIRKYKVFTKYKTTEEVDRNLFQHVTLFDLQKFPLRVEPR